MYKIKTEDVYKDFSKDKEMFDFSNCCAKSKFYNSDALVVGIKPKNFFLVDGSSTHKKVKSVNKNNVTKISQPI